MIVNNNLYIKESGFTLVEILVAVFIMSIGFLALSQMEFLSVRQKQMAEQGSNATNLLQFAADRDLAELKRVTLLNNQTFITEARGNSADYTYCDGSSDSSVCSNCPCNPLASIAPDLTTIGTAVSVKDTQCAAIDIDSSDIKSVTYTTDEATCLSNYHSLGAGGLGADGLFVLRRASVSAEGADAITIDSIFTVNLTYTAKSFKQFVDSEFSLALRDNLAVQGIAITAQTEDYSDTVPVSSGSWGSVVVPYVP
jgi:prepilin-type N-terminal cleavage/methylation domain-containing protein